MTGGSNYNGDYRLTWQSLRFEWPLWMLIVAVWVLAVWAFPHLPASIPSHWNVQGRVDGYMSRTLGTFLFPSMVVAVYVLMLVLPLVDPRRRNYVKFGSAYVWIRWLLVVFFSVVYALTILYALGVPMDIGRAIQAGVGVLFIMLGNFLSQIRHNYFVGIRTPWTLANEKVWAKTHRFTGKLFVVAGILGVATVYGLPREVAFAVTVGGVAASALGGMVYSYVIYMVEQRSA